MNDDSVTPSDLRAAVTSEMRQQLTPYALKVDQMSDDLRMVKWTLYGNEAAGELGLVKGVKSMQSKLDRLIELSQARDNQWKGIRTALIIVGSISSVPTIQVLLPVLGRILGIQP